MKVRKSDHLHDPAEIRERADSAVAWPSSLDVVPFTDAERHAELLWVLSMQIDRLASVQDRLATAAERIAVALEQGAVLPPAARPAVDSFHQVNGHGATPPPPTAPPPPTRRTI